MKQNKLFIKNPVTLHFYSTEEQLPDDDSYKIVICSDGSFDFGFYDSEYKVWATMNECIQMYNVIAWATFSPEWVVSETDRDIFGCK